MIYLATALFSLTPTFAKEPKNSEIAPVVLGDTEIIPILRSNCQISEYDDRLNIGRRGKLGGPNDGLAGILDTPDMSAADLIAEAQEKFRKDYLIRKRTPLADGATYPGETWFKYIKNRRPLLVIYFINAKGDESSTKSFNRMKTAMGDAVSVGFALGFPANDNQAIYEISCYRANKTYNYFERDEILTESEEEE